MKTNTPRDAKGPVYLQPTQTQPTFSTHTIALVYKKRQRFLPQSSLHAVLWARKIGQGTRRDCPLPVEAGLVCPRMGSRALHTEVPGDSNAASSFYADTTQQANTSHHSVDFLQSSA